MALWENGKGPAFYADRTTPVPLAGDRCTARKAGDACKLHVDHNGPCECICGAEWQMEGAAS